ncbi:hypothetical protein V1498_19010 [Peribacillus sp. SCS-26]
MSTEQKQEAFAEILKKTYDASSGEALTLQEIMAGLEGDLSQLIGD